MIWPCALIVLIARTTPIDPNKQSTLCFIYSSFCSSATKGYLAVIPMKIPEIPKEHLLCPANLVPVGMRQQFAQRSSLLVASDSRCQATTARYKCN
jgi:hypothetical protein